MRLMLSPAYVQGESAPLSLMAAIDRADAAGADVILLVRGGGSFEDLSAFNDERLVRKLRSLKTPVIAGSVMSPTKRSRRLQPTSAPPRPPPLRSTSVRTFTTGARFLMTSKSA